LKRVQAPAGTALPIRMLNPGAARSAGRAGSCSRLPRDFLGDHMIALSAAIRVHFKPVSYSWQLADKSHTAPAFLTFAGRLIRSAGRIGLHNPQTTTDIDAARQPFTGRKTGLRGRGYRLCVGPVILLSLHIWLHVGRRYQANGVPKRLKLPRPIMR
jgi:hypothetical protein